MELLERQREVHALRTRAEFLVEALNGKYVAWMASDLSALEAIASRLASDFGDLNGERFAEEILSKLEVRRPARSRN
jgi:hypothetical protein